MSTHRTVRIFKYYKPLKIEDSSHLKDTRRAAARGATMGLLPHRKAELFAAVMADILKIFYERPIKKLGRYTQESRTAHFCSALPLILLDCQPIDPVILSQNFCGIERPFFSQVIQIRALNSTTLFIPLLI